MHSYVLLGFIWVLIFLSFRNWLVRGYTMVFGSDVLAAGFRKWVCVRARVRESVRVRVWGEGGEVNMF